MSHLITPCLINKPSDVLNVTLHKFRYIVVICGKQYREDSVKLPVQQISVSTNQCCYFTLQNEMYAKLLHRSVKKGQVHKR